MRIILDGMGGDNAPAEIVKGAVEAAAFIDKEIVIVGKEEAIKEELKKCKYTGNKITVVNADDVITMEDSPVKAIRRKTDSSLVVALNLVKESENDILISGGNTGALVVGSRMILGRIDGIDRPVLASIYPCLGAEPALLVDAGASSEAKANNLVEYGLMGSIYVDKVWGRTNPRVGLVNIGAEETKGTSITKDAHQKLKEAPVNFIGNVEGRDIPYGVCEVLVCDGFTGNIILKLTEGLAKNILKLVIKKLMTNLKTKMAALLIKPQLMELKQDFDYEEYGGAPILGVNGAVIKIHGSSTSAAVKNAIIKGIPYGEENVVEIIRKSVLDIEEIIEEGEEE
jgi:glycerol-3-phosphate acyltransferase PlsX